jgi:hypothetical protein
VVPQHLEIVRDLLSELRKTMAMVVLRTAVLAVSTAMVVVPSTLLLIPIPASRRAAASGR